MLKKGRKKKGICFCVLIAIFCMQFSAVTFASEKESGIPGISTNDTYYYVRNSAGEYLSCSKSGKLTLDKKSDPVKNVFKVIKSGSSIYLKNVQGYYVCVTGTEVKTSKTMISAAKISIARNSGKYLIMGVDSKKYFNFDLKVKSYNPSDAKKLLWGLETTSHGKSSVFTMSLAEGGWFYCTSVFLSGILLMLDELGYSAKNCKDYSAACAYDYLQSNSIFISILHGADEDGGYITFSDGTNLNAYKGRNNRNNYYIGSLPENSLAQSKCVVYMACNAGNGVADKNLVTATYQKGAHCVIAPKKAVAVIPAQKWVDSFVTYAYEHENATIQQCIDYACKHSSFAGEKISKSDLNIIGDTDARINY